PRPVAAARLRIRSDQRVEITRLKLVRVRCERLDVGDAVVADAGGERLRLEGERAEYDIPAGAPALHPGAVGVGVALLREVPRGGNAVLPVDLPPAPVERAPVRAAEAGAAAVVDVDDPDAALRPEEERRRQ